MLTRRSFVGLSAVAPFALPVMVKAAAGGFTPIPPQIGQFEQRPLCRHNGIPCFTGFKPAQASNVIGGQWVVAWTPTLPLGAAFSRREQAPVFLYCSVVLRREEIQWASRAVLINDGVVRTRMHQGAKKLAEVVDEHVKWKLSDWRRYREFVRYVERGSYVDSAYDRAVETLAA